jgi:hypothetical protein
VTSPERAEEADAASTAFHIALARTGARSIEEALTLWEALPPAEQAATASRWLSQAIRLILFRRSKSRALGLAYYRLVRALRTGTTVADPRTPEPTYVPLSTLRREFALLAGQPEPAQEAGDDLILVEPIDGLGEEMDRIEQAAAIEARDRLIALGPALRERKTREIDTSQPAQTVDAQRAEAQAAAGRRVAADSERIVLNGARSVMQAIGTADKKVIGWVRVSRTGTPCGWCAMLISRGLVKKNGEIQFDALYTSIQSASKRGNPVDQVDEYHPNCKCYAEPIYGLDQARDSPLFNLNRQYAELWPQVTRGLGGESALAAWRNFIRREQAQAALRDPNAQEATQ